jgi:hypothetical protein
MTKFPCDCCGRPALDPLGERPLRYHDCVDYGCAPFEDACRVVDEDDEPALAPAESCKRCGRESCMTTPEERARFDAAILAAITLWHRTPYHERAADAAVTKQLSRAGVYAEYLVAADQGYCRTCSPMMVQPALLAPTVDAP